MKAPGGRSFLLGVNYWPRRKAMYWWEQFDEGEVRDEFACIRDLGLTHVRVFLLWESFQPAPDQVRASALRDPRTVCDVAAELGLAVEVTFFTGHMSGPTWAPPWLIDRRRPSLPGQRQVVTLGSAAGAPRPVHDIYATPFVVAAEDRLLRSGCRALLDHPAVWGWSLGNEPDLFCRRRDAETGRRWVRDRRAVVRSIDPGGPVLVGLYSLNLEADVGFRLEKVAAETDLSVMHGYPFYSRLARWPLDPDYVPFTAAVATALAGCPVLYEEFGVNTSWPDGPSRWADQVRWDGARGRAYFASEEGAAAYLAAVLSRLLQTGSLGAFIWCFADYAQELWDRPPSDFQFHERFFGLVRPDGTLKPGADVVRQFARTAPMVRAPARTVALEESADAFYPEPEQELVRLYERFGTLP